jgi:hypothetical protein
MAEPKLFGFPLNRLVAFLGPYLSVLSGGLATWLFTHVHLFATFHVGTSDIAHAIVQAVVFGLTTAVTYAGQHKWLDGFQKWAYSLYEDISHTEVPDSSRTDVHDGMAHKSHRVTR